VKGTKLWQAAGSPIIQGRSRRQRPSWQQWLPAWIIASAVTVGFLLLVPAASQGSTWSTAGCILGALVGAFAGVEITRAMGWRFPLFWGAVVGLVGAGVLLALTTALLPK
jgi:hypothetical protein